MPNLYVKLDGENVIEASIEELEGAEVVTATDQQIEEIMSQRKDAIVESGSVSATTEGEDFTKRQAVLAQRAESNLPQE